MKMEPIERQAVLHSERLTLRPIRRSDSGLIAQFGADKRVAMMTATIAHPLPEGASELFVERALDGQHEQLVWALDAQKVGLGELIGLVSLDPIDDGHAEIGYWIAPALWNNGFAGEAVAAIIAANPLASSCFVASVFQDNPASAKVLTKQGFALLGDSEAFSVARNATAPTWDYVLRLA